MRHITHKTVSTLFFAALLSVPAFADTASERGPANPGTVNYVEGQVSVGNQTVGPNTEGTVVLAPEQSVTTQNGKAEILLTPGVFLRVGDNSSVKMISPNLTNTEVEVDRGEAIVEVAEIHPENRIRVDDDGAITQLQKTGLYDFDADHAQVRVLDGQAMVEATDRRIKVKSGHEVKLNVSKFKEERLNEAAYQTDDLYRWSSLRSSYVAEANIDVAPRYDGANEGWYGYAWAGSGWHWDPWFGTYTFIPGDGIFYSPFGWGFYSPIFAHRAPSYFGGLYYHHFGPDVRGWGPGPHYAPGFRGGGFGTGFGPGYRGGVSAGRGGLHGGFGGGFGSGGGFHGGGHGR